MLELNPLEVVFELADLSIVSIHCVFNTIPLFVDLFDDNLRIAERQWSLDAKGNYYSEPMN
jgi:hypothetical protein